jgi:flagellar hook protein FlgE
MLKSLYAGVSGMQAFQNKLDVIGNNIANVNTVGFKKSRTVFQDILSQNISGATAPTGTQGGVNPRQIGLGVKVGAIDTLHTPGSPMTTNIGTDLAIDGDAYFVVSPNSTGSPRYFTRAGNFTRDANGNLVNANGYFVMGGGSGTTPIKIDGNTYSSYSIDANGNINAVRKTDGGIDTNPSGGPIATAVVSNPGGMEKVGNTMFRETTNSGAPNIASISSNGGTINSGVLEMSNVDLTEEFTEMIVAQRGFQANARTITTSDSILQEVVDLKRS